MFRNILILLVLFLLLGLNTLNPSFAGLFKKKKVQKDQVTEQAKEAMILLVEVFASWCPGCKNIQPTLDQLLAENQDLELIQLDVSTPSKAKIAAKRAEELGVKDFFALNKSKTATVGVVVPSKELISVFQNNNDLDDYKAAIEKAKTKEQTPSATVPSL